MGELRSFKIILTTMLLIFLFSGCATTPTTGPGVEPEIKKKVEKVPDEPLDVSFAGFAFVGDYREKDKLYPYSSKLAEETMTTGQTKLNHALFNAAKNIKNPSINFKLVSAMDIKKGETISLAFAVSTEKNRIQAFGNQFFVHYEVYAQILVFDFSEKKVLATFPIRIQYSEVLNQKPSEAHSLEIFRKIYLEPGFKANIVDMWVERMNSIKIKESFGNYIRISSVEVPSETLKFVPAKFSQNKSFNKQAAQLLETSLSANQKVPVVPYAEGGSLGKMRVQFVNNDISDDFKLPEADYGIDLKVRPFKKYTVKKKGFSQVTYGSFIDLKLHHLDLDTTYMDASFRNIPMATVAADVKLNDWDEFLKSLHGLLDRFTKQISEKSSAWLENATRTDNIKGQLKKFESVLSDVR
tara:strand:+ start:365 stop:1597 length:1233 start_codon:yes stop_codon:yes gene_type:complete